MRSRYWFALLTAVVLPILNGCGGSDSNDNGASLVRVVNATTSGAPLDFYVGTSVVATAVAPSTSSSYASIGAGTYALYLNNTGSATNLNGSTRTLTAGASQTLLAYTSGGTLNTVYIGDNDVAGSTGTARFRVYNLSNEAGTLDVYVTAPTADLNSSTATANGIASTRLSSYGEIAQGTYRIRVTGTGDKSDLRLDIPSVTLSNGQLSTLVLTTAPSGVLVHGLLMNQQAASTSLLNPSARVRLLANVTGNTAVASTINSVVLSTGLTSPAIGAYALVPAGTLTGTISAGGTTLPLSNLSAAAGSDVTLLVMGTVASPKITLIADDNTPSVTTTNAKIRLVNAANNLSGNVTLTANYGVVANDVSFATASAPSSVTASDTYRLEATTPATVTSLYLATPVSLQAGKVYTVFMIGDGATATGILRRDR